VLSLSAVGASSAYGEEVAPHWQGPYPKTFHIHTASLHSNGEGIVPVTFVAREMEGEETIAATILQCQTDRLRLEFNLEAVCKSPKATYNVRIRGSAIGEIRPINTLSNVFTVAFKRSGWEQEPSMFEGGLPANLESEVGTSGPQPTAVDTTEFLKFPKVTEIRRGH
jgi:hypothetical protein